MSRVIYPQHRDPRPTFLAYRLTFVHISASTVYLILRQCLVAKVPRSSERVVLTLRVRPKDDLLLANIIIFWLHLPFVSTLRVPLEELNLLALDGPRGPIEGLDCLDQTKLLLRHVIVGLVVGQ